MKAMILAAGLGTRFKPWTDQHPKALAVINGRSLLQRNIEYLQRHGIYDVVVNVHHFAEQIRLAIATNKGWGSRVEISDETDAVLETGGGLMKAADYLRTGPFVLINVDILTDMDLSAMVNQHLSLKPLATIAVTGRNSSRFFLFDQNSRLCGWRNTASGEEKIIVQTEVLQQRAFSGIHVIEPDIFKLTQSEGKFSMVDLYLSLARDHVISGFDHTGTKFIDVGRPEAVEPAEKLFI